MFPQKCKGNREQTGEIKEKQRIMQETQGLNLFVLCMLSVHFLRDEMSHISNMHFLIRLRHRKQLSEKFQDILEMSANFLKRFRNISRIFLGFFRDFF